MNPLKTFEFARWNKDKNRYWKSGNDKLLLCYDTLYSTLLDHFSLESDEIETLYFHVHEHEVPDSIRVFVPKAKAQKNSDACFLIVEDVKIDVLESFIHGLPRSWDGRLFYVAVSVTRKKLECNTKEGVC